MRYILILLLFISGAASAQFLPTSAKTKFVNGIAIGSRDTSQFTAADTIALTIARDSVMYYRYRGFWRPIATGGNLSAYKLISDTLFNNGYTTRARLKQGLDSLAATKVSSVGLTMPSAFNVANSPITTSGTIAVTAAGNASQYIRGDGVLANLPTNGGGGGASVSYYLNGSVNQGTIGGVTYYEMNKTPIIGAGTDFTRNSNGYIASFLTDANDPALLVIPAGNWNFETYFEASSGGGTPTFYIELYKYDGTTFTLIASNSTSPKSINDGTNIEAYFSALAVPQTTLALTDRLAIRIFVTTAGRTITLHTENNTLCQVVTTFTTGLTALNGLTAQVQYFATGTSGSDFNISSATDTHTFNLPTASATNRGALSSANWTTFNNKIGPSDTASMLAPYFRDSDTTGLLSQVVRTFGTQTVGGNKTFSGITIVSNTTASTSTITGALRSAGGLGVAGAAFIGGNLTAANGNTLLGTTTDNGADRLQVLGSTSFTNSTTAFDGGILSAEILTSANWTTTGWTGDFVAGFTNNAGNTIALSNSFAAVIGTAYQIAYTITNRTAGIVTITLGGQSISTTATGTFGPTAITTGNLVITPTSDFNGTIVLSIRTISNGSASILLRAANQNITNQIRISGLTTNTFIGFNAGTRNTTGGSNSAFGANALLSNTTGNNNSAVGRQSLQNNTTGGSNSSFGVAALFSNTAGNNNSAVGANALLSNTTGNNNSAVGSAALTSNTTGNNNSAVGLSALTSNTTGNSNSAFGASTLLFNATGGSNLALGFDAGRRIANGSNNTITDNSIYIGVDTRAAADNQTNQIVIGHTAIGLGSNTTVVGNSSTTFGRWFGRLLLGTSTDAGFQLDVNGTARMQGNLTVTATNATGDFATIDGTNILRRRTAAQVLSDIGGQAALTLTTTGTSGAATLVGSTLNIPNYAPDLSGYVPTSRTITINGTSQDLSANRTFNVGTVTSVSGTGTVSGLTLSGTVTSTGNLTLGGTLSLTAANVNAVGAITNNTSGTAANITATSNSTLTTLSALSLPYSQLTGTPSLSGFVTSVTASSPLASSGGTTPNITIQQASGSQNGFLSSTDWTSFNSRLTQANGDARYLQLSGGTLTGALNGTSAAFTLNQNATTRVQVTNTDVTNSNSRASFRATSGTVLSSIQAINGLGSFIGSESNHDLHLLTNGNSRQIVTASGRILMNTSTDNGTDALQVNGSIAATSATFSGAGSFGTTLSIGSTATSGQLSINGAASDAWSSSGASSLVLNGNAAISTISTFLDNSSIRIGAGVTQKTGIFINGHTATGGSYVSVTSGNAEAARFTANRNLLIKTTTDNNTDALQVVGSGLFSSSVTANSFIRGSGLVQPISLKTSNYTLTNNDHTVIFDATAANRTATLPAGVEGQIFVIKGVGMGVNSVTIAASSGQTIETGSSYNINIGCSDVAVTIQFLSGNWNIISSHIPTCL